MTGSNHVLPTCGAARGRGGLDGSGLRARLDRAATDRGGPAPAGAGGDRARDGRRARAHAASIAVRCGRDHHERRVQETFGRKRRRAPAPQRERRRLLSERARRPAARSRRAMPRSIPTTTPRNTPSHARFACPPTMSSSPTGSTKASWPPRPRRCATATRPGIPEAIGVAPAFDMYEVCTNALGGRMVNVPLGPDVRVSVGRTCGGDHRRRRASCSSPTRTIRPVSRLALDDLRPPRPRRLARAALRRRGVRGLLRRDPDRHADALASPPNLLIGRTFAKSYGLAGLRAGAVIAHPETLQPLRQVVPPYSLNAYATAALPVALEDRDYCDWYVAQAQESRRAADGDLRHGSDCGRGRARRISCWSHAGSRAGALVDALAGPRHLRPGSLERSRVRGLHPHDDRRRRGHAAAGDRARGGLVRRGSITRNDARDLDPAAADDRGTRPLRRVDRHSLPRSHARARRSSRRRSISTLQVKGDLDVDQHHTVEDAGIALGEAVSAALGTRRGINRAGYFVMPMDETLAVAAIDLGGRPHAVVDLALKVRTVGDLQSELVQDFFEGLRAGRARQRSPEGALRPVEPSPGRGDVQGVRACAARGVLHATGSSAATLPVDQRTALGRSTIRTCCPHRLRRRQPDLRSQGARRDRCRVLHAVRRRPTSARDRRHHRSRRRPLRRHAMRSTARGAPQIRRRRPIRTCHLLGICLGLQYLFEAAATRRPRCLGLGLLARALRRCCPQR